MALASGPGQGERVLEALGPMPDTIDVCRVLPAWSVPPSRLTEDEFVAAAAEAPTTPPDRYTTLEHLAMHERGMRDQLCVCMEAVAALRVQAVPSGHRRAHGNVH